MWNFDNGGVYGENTPGGYVIAVLELGEWVWMYIISSTVQYSTVLRVVSVLYI